MPRKKLPVKFKYTIRRDGVLYVKYPVKGLKNPVWRVCHEETQEAVNETIAAIEAEVHAQRNKQNQPDTLTKFFGEWLETLRPTITPRTYADYGEIQKRYVEPQLGDRLLVEITPLDIQRLYNELHKRVDAIVVKKVHSVLSNVFKQAVRWRVLRENPAADLVLPRVVEQEAAAMSADEVRRFVAACQTSLEYVVLEFALETGLRPEEYLALDWKTGIDLKNCRVHVRRAVSFARSGGGFVFKETKTKNSRRTVSFSRKMRDRLQQLLAAQEGAKKDLRDRINVLKRPVRGKYTPKSTPNRGANQLKRATLLKNAQEKLKRFEKLNLVFSSGNGNPIIINNLGRRQFKDVLVKAGIDSEKYYLYSLRHTNATILAEKIKPSLLQKWLGHASITTTFKYYVHLSDDAHAETSEIIADALY